MKTYNVGVEGKSKYCDSVSDFGSWDFDNIKDENFEWMVYAYYTGSYEGDGEAVGYKDGNLYFYGLGHCSCYGPLEAQADMVSVDKWKTSVDIHDTDAQYKEVRDKLVELLT